MVDGDPDRLLTTLLRLSERTVMIGGHDIAKRL